MKCKHCGTTFHYCSSCDPDRYYDLGYCSESCMKDSYSFKSAIANAKDLVDSFTPLQKHMFKRFVDKYFDFEDEIDSVLSSRLGG